MHTQIKQCLYSFLSLILISSPAKASNLDCYATPDCSALGYTMTEADCEGTHFVRCPTDTSKLFCKPNLYKSICEVGDVLGNDEKCYDAANLPQSVKPIAVVFDVENRLAVALTDVKQDGSAGSERMLWSSSYCDAPNLENCTNSNTVITTCGADGRANTDAILASTCNGTPYAANAVNNYQISGCSKDFCKQGKWFLPSMRDLYTIYSFKSAVNNTLSLLVTLGASQFMDGYYWSSIERYNDFAWVLGMSSGFTLSYNKYSNYYVRPVLHY